ncbi:cryptochrome/photolyase family protein [Inhella inkyongensis]|nr:deoxyribodipyrimidine photo-lyase [Inhella inkyongensis]
MSSPAPTLVWLRRDLRLHDHAALELACRDGAPVLLAFVFDTDILDALPRQDRRVELILEALLDLEAQLRERHPGLGLIVRSGRAREQIPELLQRCGAQRLVFAHDDDPFALARDQAVRAALPATVRVDSVRDVTVFERRELLTGQGRPYTVFTPYKKAWLRTVDAARVSERRPQLEHLAPSALAQGLPSLSELGFEATDLHPRFRGGATQAQALWAEFREQRLAAYADTRDFPARKGPSYLSPALRFGLVSVRELAREALGRPADEGAATWLSELIWRDFYHQVLHHHPGVVNGPLKPEYAAIAWEEGAEADTWFEAWCAGQTGFPLVDAAMRQLAQTGYMHNRLRMVTASFLCKTLGIDWRRGEAWFAQKLLDFELASNSGGWQWAASCGCDAQPWFRIFNPVTQSEKFDPKGLFIRRYVPELAPLSDAALHAPWEAAPLELGGVVLGRDYPAPLILHAEGRARTLARYGAVRGLSKD